MAEAGKTAELVAEHVGRGESTVGDWMRGDSQPKFAVIEKVAKFCGRSPVWIIFGEGYPDHGDAEWGPLFARYKDHPLFALAFSLGAALFAEEGFEADFAYLVRYASKLLGMAESLEGNAGAEEKVRAAVDAERAEIRAEKEEIRKKRG